MHLRSHWFGYLVVGLAAASSLAAQATVLPLQGRDINGNPVAATASTAVFEYDPNLNLTWLRNWDVNGLQNWTKQVAWAAGLTVGAYTGWALPTIDAGDTTCSGSVNPGGGFPQQYYGFNCTGGDMGYLWYTELRNVAGALSNPGPFQNMQSFPYWSGTEYVPFAGFAWYFSPFNGIRNDFDEGAALDAVAVRPGDVAVAARVSEPQTLGLALAGLMALWGVRRRRPG